ncbi:MAG: hypothetical protein JWP91_1359 [Fibrobacteres bacterium]|nr:hypothetical protein [Fibrobacterota bacterium]
MIACTVSEPMKAAISAKARKSAVAVIGLLTLAMLGSASGQTTPPAELILKGKVRDFIEDNPTRTPIHPHFYGNRAHLAGCNAQEAGVNIAQLAIDTTNDLGDTSVFKGDNRGPKLVAPLDPKVAACFEPVSRFNEWYNDRTAGDVNRAFLIDIKFTRNPVSGVYEYFDDEFFPIDNGKPYRQLGANPTFGHLLAAPNNIHNYGFTMEFHANFTYFKGTGQKFTFRGDDDVWVFINGKRVIDLGGMHPAQDAGFDLDAVAAANGLQDSLVYPLDFFFAERHTTTSKLRITTTLELEPLLGKPVVTAGRYFEGQVQVTMTHSSPAAVLHYTTDGSTPTASSPIYAGPITLSATATVKVMAVRPGYRNSEVATETFTKMETVATPKAEPPGQIFVDPLQVALTVATPGAVIRYTLNGSDPDGTSPVYSGPLTVSVTTTLKAKAFLADWVASGVMTEIYTDASTLPPPVASPAGIGFVGSQIVSLSVPGHPDAQIRFTLDGAEPTSSSPLYAAALTFTGTTTLKAKAFKKDWKTSQTMTERYERLAAAVKAVYVDFDGDGRIDGAVVRLDIPVPGIPASIRLVDPFNRAALVVGSSAISKGASDDQLVVRFPDGQFTPGTRFPTEALGSFPDVAGFGFTPFMVSDSAGPVPVKAVSHNKTNPEDHASVDVTFSEPINLAEIQAGPSWPFDIIRNGAIQGGGVRVTSVTAVEGKPDTYRWTFEVASPVWPVYIDSLVLAAKPVLHDAVGSPGVAGGKRIPVEGSPVTLNNVLVIEVTNPIVPRHIGPEPTLVPAIRKDPFAAIGLVPGGEICLNCPAGLDYVFTDRRNVRPEWIIRSKYAFSYSFTIYDHLGAFVNKTKGQIDEAMMARIAQDAEGFRSIRFRWIPVAANGDAVATGAYILKGTVLNKENESQKGAQGESQVLKQSQTAVFATFGYLRQY